MFDYKLARVEKILHRLYRKGYFENKNIYLFGVSENTRQMIQILRACQLNPVNVLDNDKIKQNTYCSGIQVISIEEVPHISDPQNLYLICSLYWREMAAQLNHNCVKKENILTLYYEESLTECFLQAMRGKKIYHKLIDQYGDVPVFACPYTGTGDIYLIGTFWKQYIEKNHIEDYVFLVISKACEKVAKLFNIKNVVVLSKKAECSYLIRYYMLCPEKVKLILLNDSWQQVHTNPLEWFRGYKGLEFMEQFRKFVFELPDSCKPEHPVFQNVDQEAAELLKKNRLQEGNTVVLSPYSNTLADLPKQFWSDLAEKLEQVGFSVCTNSIGDTEPAIEGTVPLTFSLDIAPQVIAKAGFFIGIRSGFCDVISGAKAKKVILYHAKERFFNGSTYEYFSLKRMGLSKDAVEIQFEKADEPLCEMVMDGIMH